MNIFHDSKIPNATEKNCCSHAMSQCSYWETLGAKAEYQGRGQIQDFHLPLVVNMDIYCFLIWKLSFHTSFSCCMYFVYAYIMLLERLTFVFPVSASSFFPEMRSHLAREVSLRKSQLRMTLQVWREEMSFKGRGMNLARNWRIYPKPWMLHHSV